MAAAKPRATLAHTEIPMGADRSVRIGRTLGHGSSATVYRGAYRSSFGLERSVAVKVLAAMGDDCEATVEDLTAAARRAACIHHPNVARIEDVGVLGGSSPYLVMELVDGHSLATLVAQGEKRRTRLPLDIVLFIAMEIAEALSGARLACSPGGTRLGLAHGEFVDQPGAALVERRSKSDRIRNDWYGAAGVPRP